MPRITKHETLLNPPRLSISFPNGDQPDIVITLQRSDLPGGINSIAEAEAWINNVWIPSVMPKDSLGQPREKMKVVVTSVSPGDIQWEVWAGAAVK